VSKLKISHVQVRSSDPDRWVADLLSSYKTQVKKSEIDRLGLALVIYCHSLAWVLLTMGLA
jgi:hypothetical protein